MKLRVTWSFTKWKDRQCYQIRKRGWINDPARGVVRLDAREMVPDEIFEKKRVEPRERTNRGDTIAADYAATRERELNEGREQLRQRRMLLRELGEHRIKKRRNEVSAETLEREAGWLDALCKHLGEDADPALIDISVLEDYRDDRLDDDWVPRLGTKGVRKISPRTVHNECSYAVALIKWGYERRKETGMLEMNVTVPPQIAGSEGRGGARRMTVDEFWRAYDKAALRPRAAVKSQVTLALGFATWLRLDALLNLQWSWIDTVAATVTVPREYMKGGTRDLELPLNRFAMSAIERARQIHKHEKYVLPVNAQTGRPATNLFHTLKEIATDAGVRPFSLHSLRKLGASTILNHKCADRHANGINKIVCDTILAHTIPSNDDAYLRVDLETMRDALSVIDELWEERNKSAEAPVVEISARRA